jgi:GT2 family glycosyltransferase
LKGISVLIPTYNRPKFLRRALLSVLNQTRLPDEIIISDDNPSSSENFEAIRDLIERYSIVKYKKNKRNIGVIKNYLKLLDEAKYEYIKFLADDDFLHPQALELMEKVLDTNKEISLVSSKRIAVNSEEEIIQKIKSLQPLSKKDTFLNGKEVIEKSITDLENYVGEFSTYMFRKSLLDINPFNFCNIRFRANADWVLWMYLLSKGNLFYYARPLSAFTVHKNQDQLNEETEIFGIRELIELTFNDILHKKLGINLDIKHKAGNVEKLLMRISLLSFFEKKDEMLRLLLDKYRSNIKIFTRGELPKKLPSRPSFSIIIVTYNSSSTIELLLQSINDSISTGDEVIVIDNNSTDNTVNLVRNFLKKYNLKNFRLIELKKNLGYAAAVNKGVELAKNEYLAFVNPDTVLPKNWISKVYRYIKEDEVGAVGAVSNYVLGTQAIHNLSNFVKVFKDEDFREHVNLINKHLENLYDGQVEEKKLLIGFFLVTKKKVFNKVGKFDQELFLGMDDLDYSLKLQEHGYKLILPKDLFVYHKGHVSFSKNSESENLRQMTENLFAEKLIKKYGFGQVPIPEELWGEKDTFYFCAFVPNKHKYKFMFKFSNRSINFREAAKKLAGKPKVGIITVTYYSSNDISLMAKSLLKSQYQNFHWYIVDHSENEEEFKRLKNIVSKFFHDKFTLIKRRNLGYASGTNYGIDLALKEKCEYIWILNPDIEVESDTLLELLKTSLFTGTSVVTCKIKDSLRRENLQYDGFKVDYRTFPDYPQRIHEPFFLSGANILLKADVLKKIRFREDYFLYFEDNEIFEDLKKLGIKVLYTPYSVVYHKNKEKTFLTSPTEIYYYFRNYLIFSKKHSLMDLNNIRNTLLATYKNLYSNKNRLRALILAIYDGIFNKTGKREIQSKNLSLKDDNKILNDYLQLRKISKVLAMKKGKDYLLSKPRNIEVFTKYLSDALNVICYMEKKNERKGECFNN